MILRARHVVPMSRPPVEDGAVVVENDAIVAVGPTKEIRARYAGEVRDLGEAVLLPGLINAHCHLDYTDMLNELEWRDSFIEWILQLVALKGLRSEKQYGMAIQSGLKQLLRSGTTSVINIECFPRLIEPSLSSPLRVWWCLELIDFNRPGPVQCEDLVRQALELVASRPEFKGGIGLSPHAPYTASGPLYRQAARFAREKNLLITTHLAESDEEIDMFRRGTGPMHDYFSRVGRDMSDCKRVGPVQWLSDLDVLGPNCLAAHVNRLTPPELDLFRDSGAHVVHCPKSHRFFNRDTPLLGTFWQHGVNVCLGTDSLASNDTLDMFAEMKCLARLYPELSADRILWTATVSGAKALNLADKLGTLAPGAWADLIAVPLDDGVADPYEAVVFAEKPICFSMIAGKVVYDGRT